MTDIFEYDDFRVFVADWLGERKGRSQRKLATELGLAPSTLSQVLKLDSAARRRLPERAFGPLCELLALDDQESRYLVALIDYGQALKPEEKEHAFERMAAIRAFQFGRGMTEKQYELFSEWHHAAVLELAHCDGFRADPRWIADTLVPSISEAAAAKSLALLKELRLIEPTGGTLRPTTGMVIDNEWGTARARKDAARNLQRKLLVRASEALDEFGPDDRLVISATVALASEDLDKARARMLAALQDVLELGTAAGDRRDQVIEVMFQLFPLSGKTSG